jgi:hypothetical protein
MAHGERLLHEAGLVAHESSPSPSVSEALEQ